MDVDTADLDRQIAELQAERAKKYAKAGRARLAQEKEEAKILIGTTPTKPVLKGWSSSITSYKCTI